MSQCSNVSIGITAPTKCCHELTVLYVIMSKSEQKFQGEMKMKYIN